MKKGWERKKLGDVCQTSAGGTPLKSRKEFYEDGDIPWLLSGEVSKGEITSATHFITSKGLNASSAKLFPINTVLVAMYGATAGQVGILRFEASTNQAVCGILPSPLCLPEFLFYAFLHEKDGLVAQAAGNAQPNISQKKIKDTEIPIPPLAEQKRIVGILDEAFAGIATARANAEKNLENARALFSSSLSSITSESEQKHWLKSTVAELAVKRKGSIRTGPFGSQLLHSEFVDEGIAVLGIDNAVANEFRWGKNRFITPEKYQQLERYCVHPGDVLITIMGTCGRCAIVPDDIPTAINTKHLCCITLDRRKCDPGYLHAFFLYHHMAQDFLTQRAKGSVMPGLNMGIIKELPVLLPPLERQHEIVCNLDSLRAETRHLETIYQQKLDELDALKKSLLDHAFKGGL